MTTEGLGMTDSRSPSRPNKRNAPEMIGASRHRSVLFSVEGSVPVRSHALVAGQAAETASTGISDSFSDSTSESASESVSCCRFGG